MTILLLRTLTQYESCHMSMPEFIKWIWKKRLWQLTSDTIIQFMLTMLWLRLTLYKYASSAHLNYINCHWIQYLFVVVRLAIERTSHVRRAQRFYLLFIYSCFAPARNDASKIQSEEEEEDDDDDNWCVLCALAHFWEREEKRKIEFEWIEKDGEEEVNKSNH